MLHPLVSVIIPTWNRRERLAAAINSALAQRHVPVEVLVCDDGSDDGTRDMVSCWGDARVRLLAGPKSGRPAVPRNRGIAAGRGEWLAFLDDDDTWLPGKLDEQLCLATRHGVRAVASNAVRVRHHVPEGNYFAPGQLPLTCDLRTMFKQNLVIQSSGMIHRSLLSYVGGFPEDPNCFYEDYAFWLRVVTCTDIAFVDKPLVYYRCDNPHNSTAAYQLDDRRLRAIALSNWLRWARGRALNYTGMCALWAYVTMLLPPAASSKLAYRTHKLRHWVSTVHAVATGRK